MVVVVVALALLLAVGVGVLVEWTERRWESWRL
jgi:hypothetical protein